MSEDVIIFLFKLKDGSVKRFVFDRFNEEEISKLCSNLNGDPLEKTSNILSYLVANTFYADSIRRYVYKHLPRKWAACGGLFFNKEGKLLIVKPTYKPDWLVVGGNIEENQTPLDAFRREVQEEIGLSIDNAKLLHIQYVTDPGFKGDRVQFIFDAGVLSDEQIASIKLPANELSEYRFVEKEEAFQLLEKLLAGRVSTAMQAKEEDRIIYLEQIL